MMMVEGMKVLRRVGLQWGAEHITNPSIYSKTYIEGVGHLDSMTLLIQ